MVLVIINIDEVDGRSHKTVKKFLDAYKSRVDDSPERTSDYEKLIFAEIFLHYAKDKKGDVALGTLTDKALMNQDGSSKLIVPYYIQEGLTWLFKLHLETVSRLNNWKNMLKYMRVQVQVKRIF